MRYRLVCGFCGTLLVFLLGLGGFAAGAGQSGQPGSTALRRLPLEAGAPGKPPVIPSSTCWITETVTTNPTFGLSHALALDAAGQPHLSYCTKTQAELKHAWIESSGWQTETVDSQACWHTSIVVDQADRVHISYVDGASVKYARYDGVAWHIETVDSTGYFHSPPSLVLDASGQPHIGYYSEDYDASPPHEVRYAYYDDVTWLTETVDSLANAFAGFNDIYLAVDSEGQPHLNYVRGYRFGTNLNYAQRSDQGWQIETVTQGGMCGSLAIDRDGRPHISYYALFDGLLHYTYYDGSAWQDETVTNGYCPTSLKLDSANRPHIANYLSGDLRYVYSDGTVWRIETVDSNVSLDLVPLALDTAGQAHIAYLDNRTKYPKYAHRPCVAASGVQIDGPGSLPAGISGLYTTTYTPLTATLPIITWDNGTVGPTAAYSWTVSGTYPLIVTATNLCSEVSEALTVTVFCQAIQEVEVIGPSTLIVNQSGIYQATPQSITASRPLTFTWDNGTVGPNASYSWSMTGTHTLTVTGTNACGQRTDNFVVRVLAEWPYSFYLPLVKRNL